MSKVKEHSFRNGQSMQNIIQSWFLSCNLPNAMIKPKTIKVSMKCMHSQKKKIPRIGCKISEIYDKTECLCQDFDF